MIKRQNIKIKDQYQLNTLPNTLINLENMKQNQVTNKVKLYGKAILGTGWEGP
jgi:hypothetical protein